MPKSKSQTHLTPDRVFDIIEEEWGYTKFYDPCPAHTPYKSSIFFNGLYGDWKNINYINSPYEVKILEKFVEKAVQQAKKGKISIMLLPTKTEQDWWRDYIVKNGYDLKWISGRLKFKNNKNNSMSSHVLVLIKNTKEIEC